MEIDKKNTYKRINKVLVLLFSSNLYFVVAKNYRVDCSKDDISIDGLNNNTVVESFLCQTTATTANQTIAVIPQKCAINIKNLKARVSYLKVCNETCENGIETYYALICNGSVGKLEVLEPITAGITYSDKIFEVGPISMGFKANLNVDASSLSHVFIGDQFYMVLKYEGVSTYKLSPLTCTAYSGFLVDNSRPHKEIWNHENCSLPVSAPGAIIDNFQRTSDGRLYARMFGFHFQNNNHVTIECNVAVCKRDINDGICGDPICGAERKKRKRSRLHRSIISNSFTVLEDEEMQKLVFSTATTLYSTNTLLLLFVSVRVSLSSLSM